MFTILLIIISFLLILLSVAFYTLFERKVLGLRQNRIAVNKTVFKGILQPVLDGLKLFSKSFLRPNKKIRLLFFLSPVIAFLIIILFWQAIGSYYFSLNFPLNVFFVLSCFGRLIYTSLLSGWRRYSKFGFIGAIRSCSQTISYEISLNLIMISFLIFAASFSFWHIKHIRLLVLAPIIVIWWITLVVERNRAPVDFREGERELISGYNIEYSRVGFALLFLAEYGLIILFSFFTSYLFFSLSKVVFIILLFIFVLLRRTFPRYRYDKLIKLIWLKILPFSCISYFVVLFLSSFSLNKILVCDTKDKKKDYICILFTAFYIYIYIVNNLPVFVLLGIVCFIL